VTVVYIVVAEREGCDGGGFPYEELFIPGVFSVRERAEEIGARYERDGYEVEILERETDEEYVAVTEQVFG
jgi:hypothetical protein